MHHALQIPEILLNIFCHVFRPPLCRGHQGWPMMCLDRNSDMVALARTCRAFKEPALDLLWSVLHDMSPVAQCLPDACSRNACSTVSHIIEGRKFKFSRALSQDELNTLRSYTHRVRAIIDFDMGFNWNSIPPQTLREDIIQDPLFPNLRFLCCRLPRRTLSSPPHQYIPTLTSIIVNATSGPRSVRNCLKPFSELYPNLRKITVSLDFDSRRSDDDGPWGAFTWPWRDLQVLSCPECELDVDDLKQLSCLPALTELSFSPSDTLLIPNLSSPLIFPNLQNLGVSHPLVNLESLSRLLFQMELPVLRHLSVNIKRFSSESVGPFLATVQNARINHSIEHLVLYHESDAFCMRSWDLEPVLTSSNLRLAMAFGNLRHLDVQVAGHVALTNSGLLELASAWPQLEHLTINDELGWNRSRTVFGGITPDGLVQLQQTCPLLNYIALVIDTRGYTNSGDALNRLPTASSRSNVPTIFRINVLDSIIEGESVSAMANWLASFVRPYPRFNFRAWRVCGCLLYSDTEQAAYVGRWEEVYRAANDFLGRSRNDGDSSWREILPKGAYDI